MHCTHSQQLDNKIFFFTFLLACLHNGIIITVCKWKRVPCDFSLTGVQYAVFRKRTNKPSENKRKTNNFFHFNFHFLLFGELKRISYCILISVAVFCLLILDTIYLSICHNGYFIVNIHCLSPLWRSNEKRIGLLILSLLVLNELYGINEC